MTQYRALVKGFDGRTIRHAGEVFESLMPKGAWVEEIKTEPEPEEKPTRRAKIAE